MASPPDDGYPMPAAQADPRSVRRPQGAARRGGRGVVDYSLTDRQRAAVERLERLADFIVGELDRIYGDPDLEDGGEAEPTLGATETRDQRLWSDGANDDRELDDEREPSLGSVGSNANADLADQRRWATGGTGDLEEEHDGREPVCEDEGAACEDEGAQCEDEGAATGDDEGDAQAPCWHSADPASPWPPRGAVGWTTERPYG
jgi:hypothetical protein